MTQATPAAQILLDGSPLRLFAVDAGLACCAVEYAAATSLLEQLQTELAMPVEQYAPANAADVLVVSGTVTHVLAPSVVALYEQMNPEHRFVVSFGACAGTGGPYWDSYAVLDGIDRVLPVDVHVPGCPPGPAALVEGLRLILAGRPASVTAPA